MPAWWGTKQNVSPKLQQEFRAMRARFGETFKLVKPDWGQLYWVGEVEVNMPVIIKGQDINPRQHTLKILYPSDYPARAAEVYILSPRVYSEKHQYEDGQLCLFNPKDGSNYGWNPERSTAVT